MRNTLTLIFAGLLAAAAVQNCSAQRKVTQNKLSPPASTQMTLSGNVVKIEYNAPSARGRQVEGGLIPYGKVWRTGADAATTLTTGAGLMIGDLKVPKGTYTIYTLAAPDGWKMVINKQTGQWGTVYTESEDLGRVPMKLSPLPSAVETMKLELKETGPKEGEYQLSWGRSMATVPIKLAD